MATKKEIKERLVNELVEEFTSRGVKVSRVKRSGADLVVLKKDDEEISTVDLGIFAETVKTYPSMQEVLTSAMKTSLAECLKRFDEVENEDDDIEEDDESFEDVELEIDPNDLKIDTFRSSGAGGQHINKTSSAIRITHLPTGMVVECQDERSQYKNKDKALKVLKSRLLKEKQDKQASEIAENRKMQVGTGDRSERIRTYNYPQGRVTDHRIGLTLYKLEEILNGSLDEVIDALVAADRAEKLKESMEK